MNYVAVALVFGLLGAGISAAAFQFTAKQTVFCPTPTVQQPLPLPQSRHVFEWHDQPMTGSKQW
jgi:hypothetical protein